MLDLTRVLLIEDDPEQVALLSLTLGLVGETPIDLIPVGLLSEGLAELGRAREEHEPFDVVLLDLTLPDGGGIAAVRAVREMDPSLALVVLTATDDEELAAAVVSEGSQDFLVKSRTDPYTVRRSLRYAVERQRMVASLQQQMLVDDLTALNNRRGFLLLGRQLLKVAERTGQSATLAFIDLDAMKSINDKYGHDQGDAALIATAAILRSVFRGADVISRIGGDEFCILLLVLPLVAAAISTVKFWKLCRNTLWRSTILG